MKKNMRKVPIIQTKAELYHMNEGSEAEKIISQIDDNILGEVEIKNIPIEQKSSRKIWIRVLLKKIKDLFKK